MRPLLEDQFKFSILVIRELLTREHKDCLDAAVAIFNHLCSEVNFIPWNSTHNKEGAFFNDELDQMMLFHVIFLLERRKLLECPLMTMEATVNQLKSAPINSLYPLVEMMSTGPSPFTADRELYDLSSYYRRLFKSLASRFVNHVCSTSTILPTEELLNWIKLLIFVESHHNKRNIALLVKHLCLNQTVDLRILLANKTFQTDPTFKAIRQSQVLAEWKQQQKKSFIQLFSTADRVNSKKKKWPEEDSSKKRIKPFRI